MSGHDEQHSDKPPYVGDDSLIVNTRQREIERERAEEKEYQRAHDRTQRRFNFLLTLFTGLLFVTSVVSDILIWRYVGLTKESADAAKSAAETAAASHHLDQRAWISCMRDAAKWKIGSEMVFPGHFTNTGKTAAKHVQMVITATLMNITEAPDFTYEPGTGHPTVRTMGQFLFPSDSVNFQLPVFRSGTRAGKTLKLTRQVLEDMQAEKTYISIHGRMTYQDVFGVDHWLNFCDAYPTVGRQFSALKDSYAKCIAYNDMDRNEQPSQSATKR